MNTKKILLLTTTLTIALLAGCGTTKEPTQLESTPAETAVEQTDATEEATQTLEDTETAESTTEEPAAEPVEEVTEDPTADLTNEEWAMELRLKIDGPTFVIFNNTIGERKILENGDEYTLVEGDELALLTPPLWDFQGDDTELYDTQEFKYNCIVYNLNYDMIGEKTEFTKTYINKDTGEPATATVYLSK